MQSFAALLNKKQTEAPVLDDKTILYVTANVIVREYGAVGVKNVIPTWYKDGKLVLCVSGSVWKSELEITRGDLRKAINKECGQKAVKEIKIKTA